MDKHVATMRPVLGDTIIKEFDRQTGVCRDTKSVTITAETNLGAVIDPDTGAPLLAANVASATSVWILADEDLYTKVDADGTYDLAVWLGAPGASGLPCLTPKAHE